MRNELKTMYVDTILVSRGGLTAHIGEPRKRLTGPFLVDSEGLSSLSQTSENGGS